MFIPEVVIFIFIVLLLSASTERDDNEKDTRKQGLDDFCERYGIKAEDRWKYL
jgi:hypothetical protein